MRKNSYIYTCIIAILIFFAPPMISSAQALFFKIDIGKSTSKITNFFKTTKAKCEKIMEDIQASQFGQFVGDGIKNTKASIAFAKSKVQQGMDFYNKTKKEVLDGDAYESAMVLKEIANKGIELKKLEEEKLIKQEEINQEIELLKEQTASKINILMQNMTVLAGNKELSKETIAEEQFHIQSQVEDLEKRLQEQIEALKIEFNAIENEYKPQEISIGNEITELSNELAKIKEDSEYLSKNNDKSAKERMTEDYEELSLPDGTTYTSAQRTQIKKVRRKKEQKNNRETMSKLVEERNEISTMESEVKSISKTADSQPGESETSGIATQVLSKQIVLVRSYISLMIADLKTQVINEISDFDSITLSRAKEKFNLCDYTDPENQQKESFISVAKEGMKKVTEGVENVTETLGQAVEQGQQLKEKTESAVSAITEAGSAVKDITDSNAADLINNMGVR
ncbi:MAG: hypothetical protein E7019_04990 [Alphaproteobacteria bacterium]|nr:hypothetical protein [Alphaproteobacteria bacterium]